jgi:hypothetical protein
MSSTIYKEMTLRLESGLVKDRLVSIATTEVLSSRAVALTKTLPQLQYVDTGLTFLAKAVAIDTEFTRAQIWLSCTTIWLTAAKLPAGWSSRS